MPGSELGRSAMEEERASLRRLAALVAAGAGFTEVLAAIAHEVARMLHPRLVQIFRWEPDGTATVVGTWGDGPNPFPAGSNWAWTDPSLVAMTEHMRTGQPIRIEDVAESIAGAPVDAGLSVGVGSAAGAPIVVDGEPWGHIGVAMAKGTPLPDRVEERLADITELVATAINSSTIREQLAQLAAEQAALRRVATLVAEEAPAAELFAKVGEEVAGVLGPRIESAIFRYEADETATVLHGSSVHVPGGIVVGERLPLDGGSVATRVFHEQRAVRVDDYSTAGGSIAAHASKHEIRAAIGCPIMVRGRVWGCMVVAHREVEPFPADTEQRVSQFTELVATALANAEARGELQRLADEQAALRRVATLVAEAAAPTELFDAVVVEVAQLLGGPRVGLVRAESAEEATLVAYCGEGPAILRPGRRLPLAGDNVVSRVLRSGRSARMNVRAEGHGPIAEIARHADASTTVGAPVTVEGRVWGVITASWEEHQTVPGDAEERVAKFAELLDTAIANADGRDQLTASRARVLTAGDDARRRVVRDLHDGAQQRLVHTMLTLTLAQRALTDEDVERARSLLAQALAHAEQSNSELRELAHGILPAVLTHGGLRAGVDAVVARLGVPVDADVTGSRLAPEIEASAYFIIAEALTNVVKHSQATRASVIAAVADGTLRIEVRDDGIGGADTGGHGLVGIGDRVAALGGRLRVDSPRGQGTALVAELPLPAS